MRKDISKLLLTIQVQIIGILKANGFISQESTNFSNAVLTQKGKVEIDFSDVIIEDSWLREWLKKWPLKSRVSSNYIRGQINRFLLEHPDINLDDINKATDKWLDMQDDIKYAGHSKYFFYKVLNKEEISICEQMLEDDEDYVVPPDQSYILDE